MPEESRVIYLRYFLNFYVLIWKSERNIDFVVPLIYAFTGCFLYVPWLETEPVTLVYQGNQLSYLARALRHLRKENVSQEYI